MSEENTEVSNEKIEPRNLYEVGFHLIPTLTEEETVAETATLVEIIEKNGGIVKNTANPQMRELSYEMSKNASGKKQKFSGAYFGHIAFEVDPKTILLIKKSIEAKPNVLRSLFIEVPPESLLPRERRAPQANREEPKADVSEKTEEIVPPMNEAELDKTIEALVIE